MAIVSFSDPGSGDETTVAIEQVACMPSVMQLGQVETDETENRNGTRKAESWNGKLKAETEKLETGNGSQGLKS